MAPSKASFLLICIFANLAMIAIAVLRYPAYWLQPGARMFVAEAVGAFVVYAALIAWTAWRREQWWVRASGFAFGAGSIIAAVEIANMLAEHDILVHAHGPAVTIAAMLTLFGAWTYVGWRMCRELGSVSRGVVAAVTTAAVCMVIVVSAGFVMELMLNVTPAKEIAGWAEFARSGWTDARAFGIANTLDAAFTHLWMAPVLASVFGGVGAAIGRTKLAVQHG